MRTIPASLTLLASLTLTLAACGDGGTSPGDGNATATRFDQIADSVETGGDYAHAEALRHAAMIVRLTGEPTPVTLTIDGQARAFVAVAEELEYPNVVCSWPGDSGVVFPDSGGVPRDTAPTPPPSPGTCSPEGSIRMRTLIAWEPERMAEVVRLVADEGSGPVAMGVPDAMAGPAHSGESWGGGAGMPTDPSLPPVDSATAPPPHVGPGFMGEYLQRGLALWVSVDGEQTNALESEGGTCTRDEVDFDWARYACQGIRARFSFTMKVLKLVPMPIEGWPRDSMPAWPPAETRTIGMAATSVAGARLSLLAWTPPPIEPPRPGPGPMPGPMPMPAPGDSGSAPPGMPTGT